MFPLHDTLIMISSIKYIESCETLDGEPGSCIYFIDGSHKVFDIKLNLLSQLIRKFM